MDRWFKIDHAGKIFTAVSKASNTSIFRVSMIITEPVKKEVLQAAVDIVIKRFPTLAVKLHKGVFWNFLGENDKRLIVKQEEEYPCYPIKASLNNGYLMRVLYFNRRISLEVFHSLTDGVGALEVLKTLVYQYLLLTGKRIDHEDMILLPEELPIKYEIEDSFEKYYQPVPAKLPEETKAFHIQGTPIEPFGHNVIHGVMSASLLNAKAKQSGATITEYLTAVLIYSIYSETMKYGIYRKPVTIAIPVNLRKIFPSKTLRNFFAVINIGIKVSEDITFEAIIEEVSMQLKEKTKKERLQQEMAKNIKYAKMLAARFVPIVAKNVAMRYGFENFGQNRKTMTLSNLGNTKLPSSMSPYVERMEAVVYPTGKSPVSCGMCSVNDKLTITFSSTITETEIIRSFFSFLAQHTGMMVEIYSNDWGVRQ